MSTNVLYYSVLSNLAGLLAARCIVRGELLSHDGWQVLYKGTKIKASQTRL